MISAAILAGGSGSRMEGSKLPKQFLKIGDKPVLVHTVEAFLSSGLVDRIVIAVHKDWLDYGEQLIETAFGAAPVSVTVGGSDRLHSLMNACAFLADAFGIAKDDIILTHDAARPFVTKRIIAENIEMLSRYDGVTTAYPVVDTILVSADGKSVDDIPSRQTMFSVQTPQTFRTGELIETVASLTETEKKTLTDAAKAYLLQDKTVGIVLGEKTNLKLTTTVDLDLAALLIHRKK